MYGNRGYHPQLTRAEFVRTDDGSGEQLVDMFGFAGEQFTKVYRPQPHGLAGHAPAKSNGILLALGGDRSKALLIGGETPAKRPKNIAEGNAVLYDATGNLIYAKGADGIELNAASGTVVIKRGGSTMTIAGNGQVSVDPAPGQNVYIGGDPTSGSFYRVSTEGGLSANVYAKV